MAAMDASQDARNESTTQKDPSNSVSNSLPKIDRRDFLRAIAAGGGVAAIGSGENLLAQAPGEALKTSPVLESLVDFASKRGALALQIRAIDERLAGFGDSMKNSWQERREQIVKTVRGQEDIAVVQLRLGLQGNPDEKDILSKLTGNLKILDGAIRETNKFLSLQPPTSNSDKEIVRESVQVKKSPELSPGITIRSPLEAALERAGVFDEVADVVRGVIDRSKNGPKVSEDDVFGGMGKFGIVGRDWRSRIAQKEHTRPQDVVPERAFKALIEGVAEAVVVDAKIQAINRKNHDNEAWKETRIQAMEQLNEGVNELQASFRQFAKSQEVEPISDARGKITGAKLLISPYSN